MINIRLADLREAAQWAVAASVDHAPLEVMITDQDLILECGLTSHRRLVRVEAHNTGAAQQLVIPARAFADWLNTQRSPDVTMEVTGSGLACKASGRATFPLITDQPAFQLRQASSGASWMVDSQALAAALAAVAGHQLTGDRLRDWEGYVDLSPVSVAMGSPYSAGIADLAGELGADGFRVVVELTALQSALKGRTGLVTVHDGSDGSVARFTWEDRSAWLAQLALPVPDFGRLVSGRETHYACHGPDLLAAVKAAVSVDTDVVRLRFDTDRLEVETAMSTKGWTSSGTAVTGVGLTEADEEWQVMVNARYLSAALASVRGEVRIGRPTGRNKSVLVEAGESRHAIQPIREGERQ